DSDTCRADERGDLLLREFHAAVAARELVLVDQALCDASRKVEEDEVLDVAGAAADAPRKEREELAHRGGVVLEHVHEIAAREVGPLLQRQRGEDRRERKVIRDGRDIHRGNAGTAVKDDRRKAMRGASQGVGLRASESMRGTPAQMWGRCVIRITHRLPRRWPKTHPTG